MHIKIEHQEDEIIQMKPKTEIRQLEKYKSDEIITVESLPLTKVENLENDWKRICDLQ